MKDKDFPKAILIDKDGSKSEIKDWSSYHFFIQKTVERILHQLQNEGLDEQDIKTFCEHFSQEVKHFYENKSGK
ncbi:hypothetical protein FL966_06045 [Caproiciproducens galactitolivorans]|uniref:Uncharacterized protein n=1 Tax=Caproiciproducens galactitolivorans TaxID=642589 RepID=A0A4Z0YA84_9FIRM|nr:hypothetical protein [Caproiciproducens galactitolivorans]QEY34650.1 hypothetical protein FL966_06045 [Caproiciproducens galactitolivorans]TGJ75880.1 hypothetical protein CAGA_20880 [Caproiciproducens galactitolivorans]